jgi:orotate phosphoribosyltransferase
MDHLSPAARTAHFLLDLGAVKLSPAEPFTWSSGWRSPIYCDNRVTLSSPEARSFLKKELAQLIKNHFPGCEGVAGVATAGIAQGALVADVLDLPYAYIRPEPKGHGLGKQIEGYLSPGQKLVLVEDLISTGGSSIKAAQAAQAAGAEVLGVIAIFDYGFPQAKKAFTEVMIPLFTISSYAELLPVALQKKIISEEHVQLLSTWQQSPESWGR